MRYFLDTEFYEDGHTIDLISIGVVAEDGREFYAVNQEARLDRVSDWVRIHVLPGLPPYGDGAWKPRAQIQAGLATFLQAEDLGLGLRRAPEIWAYYADYDWVVFCQLFGTMMDLPEHFPRFCRDLKQLSVDCGSPTHPPEPAFEHNALVDARWNRDLYTFLTQGENGYGVSDALELERFRHHQTSQNLKTTTDLALGLAHALRWAVTTEFPEERRAALNSWEAYVLQCASKGP